MSATFNAKTHAVHVDGVMAGYVVRRARVAAGTEGARKDRGTLAAGTRKHFWTATVDTRTRDSAPPWWRPGDGGSIGTRFATCEDGVAALEAYVTYHLRDPAGWRRERKTRWGF